MDDTTVATAKARARDYLRTRGTERPADEIVKAVGDAFASLGTFLDGVPAHRAGRRPTPGEWCVQEVVDHLVETHRPGLDELRCLLAGRRPPEPPIPASLQSRAPLLRPWPWLLRELGQVHGDILETLAGVPRDFETAARAPLVMVVNMKEASGKAAPLEWVEDLDWKAYALVWRLHAIDHLKQARAALAALDG
jgi:DinB family protein